jgi:hypothetical protein
MRMYIMVCDARTWVVPCACSARVQRYSAWHLLVELAHQCLHLALLHGDPAEHVGVEYCVSNAGVAAVAAAAARGANTGTFIH